MKESDYNILLETDGKKMVFNAMTCAFAEVDDSFFDALSKVREGEAIADQELLENMKYGGIIIDDNLDEKQYLKLRSYQSKFSSIGFGLTIAPTLACNFACPYCYEEAKPGFMSEELQDKLIEMVSDAAKQKKNIYTTWYGGEPMLAFDSIIRPMSERIIAICKENGVEYSTFMITNGYLVTEDVIEHLKECEIKGMQITIDGPADIHDSRRVLKGNGRGSFEVIMENVRALIKAGIHPDIRVNVDKTNKDRLPELIAIFKENGFEKCSISFGHVNAYTEACANIDGTCLNIQEYAMETIDYQKMLFDNGFAGANEYPLYPGVKGNYCCADSAGSYVVDPEGYLYKCWNDVGQTERSVGSVSDLNTASDLQQRVQADYLLWSPFDHQKCVECEILPICMGGCPYNGMWHKGEPECEKWKYNMTETLQFVYDNRE